MKKRNQKNIKKPKICENQDNGKFSHDSHGIKQHGRIVSLFIVLVLAGLGGLALNMNSNVLKRNKSDSKWPESQTIKLSNDVEMPRVGFGTAAMRGESARKAIGCAIREGFRFFDGAEATEWYDDEALGEEIKKALDDGIAQRADFFVSTKLHPKNLGTQNTRNAIQNMLNTLQVEYLDLLVIHFPICGDWIPTCQGLQIEGTWKDSWRVLEEAYKKGVIRAIGLSNFHTNELEEALEFAKIKPHIIQNWMDPFHTDIAVRKICLAHNIAYTSYSTLGGQWEYREPRKNLVFTNPKIKELAQHRQQSPSDIILAWALQKGVIVIPRSTNPSHIKSNARFLHPKSARLELQLSEVEMDIIDSLVLEP